MRADHIVKLLQQRHHADVVVTECKTGGSWHGTMQIFDLWCMPRSYTHSHVTGYEVKVDRSDFLGDNKWPGYTPYCNYFYFVCPKDLIDKSELAADIGLMYASEKQLKVVRKAPLRQVTIPDSIFRYILMTRCNITESQFNNNSVNRESKRKFFEGWCEARKIDKAFGQNVSKSIRQTVENEIVKVQQENRDLQEQILSYSYIKEFLSELGINLEHDGTWHAKDKIRALTTNYPPRLKSRITDLMRLIVEIDDMITHDDEQKTMITKPSESSSQGRSEH